MVIIGCNTVSHLSAGLVELYRTGDDTSGNVWSRTRAYGVNTLAFRLCQNDAFYKVDADCVGIIKDKIDWKLNRQWLDLLAKSGSPLFVSVQPEALTDKMTDDLKMAFAENSVQTDSAECVVAPYNVPRTQLLTRLQEAGLEGRNCWNIGLDRNADHFTCAMLPPEKFAPFVGEDGSDEMDLPLLPTAYEDQMRRSLKLLSA